MKKIIQIIFVTIAFLSVPTISFAVANCGVSTVSDSSGNIYGTVHIGAQCWMNRNMEVGQQINETTHQANNGINEKYCYSNTATNCSTSHPNQPDGGLYQWNEAMQYSTTEGSQGICPAGWRIPTNADFSTLLASSQAGLDANLAGIIGYSGGVFGTPRYRGTQGYFWSSTQSAATNPNGNALFAHIISGGKIDATASGWRTQGSSVRCVQNYVAPTFGTVAVSSTIASSWTINGPATIIGSGTSQSSASQPTGAYTITWTSVPGYINPPTTLISASQTLTSGGTITFNGTYTALASCTLPWGGSIVSGNSATAYQSSLVTSPTTCASVSESRACTNGTLSGTYTNQSCAVASSCTLPWGGTTSSGSSVSAYLFSSVPSPTTCASVSETRTCTNGTLSGTYANQSCVVITSCALPWGGTLASGTSVTAYQVSSVTSPTTCASVSQTRTCTSGTLSGTYTNQSCATGAVKTHFWQF